MTKWPAHLTYRTVERLVEAQLVVELVDLRLRGVRTQDGTSQIAGQHLGEGEHQDRHQDQRRHHEQ